MKQKLLEMVQVTVNGPFIFYFDEIRKMKQLWFKNLDIDLIFFDPTSFIVEIS